jgi:hypothetical protein
VFGVVVAVEVALEAGAGTHDPSACWTCNKHSSLSQLIRHVCACAACAALSCLASIPGTACLYRTVRNEFYLTTSRVTCDVEWVGNPGEHAERVSHSGVVSKCDGSTGGMDGGVLTWGVPGH